MFGGVKRSQQIPPRILYFVASFDGILLPEKDATGSLKYALQPCSIRIPLRFILMDGWRRISLK